MNQEPNLFKRILTKLFSIINTTRKVIVNLFFLFILTLFIIAINQDGQSVEVPEQAALVLNLTGDIVEQKREINPMDAFITEALNQQDESPEVLIGDVIDVINHAQNDNRITALILQLKNLQGSGLTKLRDIAKAIEDFKTSGKPVIAIGEDYNQDQYYLASYADDIWLDPKGSMILDGYGRYQMYYKSALDKLLITQHVFRVGTYKSAVEPYLRDDMSEAAKEANKLWLNDLWRQYKEDVAKQRDFSINNFDESIDSLINKFKLSNSNLAEYALDNQWVDELKTHEQIRNSLVELVGKNTKGDDYSHITFKDYLLVAKASASFVDPLSNKVAIVVAKGNIVDGTQGPGSIGGDSTAKLLRKARYNKQVKAVVLRVDSPGGSAYASEIIRREIDLLKAAGKPVVASMGSYAASGGYWISAPADKIIASPTTITGSIGIFGLVMTFEKSLSQLGIHTDGVGTTDIAGMGSTRPLSNGVSTIYQLNIERGYKDFISLVAENRNMSLSQVDEIAQGRVWSGVKAKELGLVDALGNIQDAINSAAELAQLKQYDTLLIQKDITAKDILLQNLFGQISVWFSNDQKQILHDPVTQFVTEISQELTQLTQFNDPQGMYLLCAYCVDGF